MGAKCCVPIKDDVPMILRKEYRSPNVLYSRSNGFSPSWSFRRDNRTHTEDIVDTPTWLSHGQCSLNVSDFRSSENLEIEAISTGSSLSNTVQLPENSKSNFADVSTANNSSQKAAEVKENSGSNSASASASDHQFSHIPTLDSVSNAEESYTLSSESWSTCSYSEITTSPQRSPFAASSVTQACMLCLKALKDGSQWDYEMTTVAILACGHAYHAGCLGKITPDNLKFDPNCPTCDVARNSKGKAIANAASSSSSSSRSRCRISRRAVVDANVHVGLVLDHDRSKTASVLKVIKLKGSFARSFLKRHFNFGAPSLENVRKKKGLWAHYR